MVWEFSALSKFILFNINVIYYCYYYCYCESRSATLSHLRLVLKYLTRLTTVRPWETRKEVIIILLSCFVFLRVSQHLSSRHSVQQSSTQVRHTQICLVSFKRPRNTTQNWQHNNQRMKRAATHKVCSVSCCTKDKIHTGRSHWSVCENAACC